MEGGERRGVLNASRVTAGRLCLGGLVPAGR